MIEFFIVWFIGFVLLTTMLIIGKDCVGYDGTKYLSLRNILFTVIWPIMLIGGLVTIIKNESRKT